MKITGIPFSACPVSDVARARAFYEGVLGLKASMDEDFGDGMVWIEYEVGGSTLALSNMWPPSGQSGPTVAFEVEDIDAALAELEAAGVNIQLNKMDNAHCFLAVITDPDGNALTVHQHKK